MTPPAQLSQLLWMIRGDTKEWSFVVLDEHNQPVDLSTITSAFFTAKASIADSDPGVFQKTIGNGVTIDGGSAGTGSIEVVPADTATQIDARVTLAFDFEVIVGGNTYTPAKGNLVIYPDVTRS